MKKSFILVFLMGLVLALNSCIACHTSKETSQQDSVTTTVVESMDVEQIIATDRLAMFMKYGNNYRWYETCIRLPEFLDSDSVTSEPTIIVNIFQSIVQAGEGADVLVWKFQHFPDGTVITDSIEGLWIEDMPMDEDIFKLTYKEAFNRMMESNFPKPHSKNAILRNPLGPSGINSQWVFGNMREQLWVDVVTGEVRTSNPAFPDEESIELPLGEWP